MLVIPAHGKLRQKEEFEASLRHIRRHCPAGGKGGGGNVRNLKCGFQKYLLSSLSSSVFPIFVHRYLLLPMELFLGKFYKEEGGLWNVVQLSYNS